MLPQNEEGFFPNKIWILAKRCRGCFKVKYLIRYIFKLHLFGFEYAMHLRFYIFYNWRSCVLFGFELQYCALLHLPCVVVFGCVCDVCGQYVHEVKIVGLSNKVHSQIQARIVVGVFLVVEMHRMQNLCGWSTIQCHCFFMVMAHQNLQGQLANCSQATFS